MFKNTKIGLRLALGFSLVIVFMMVLIIICMRQMKVDRDNLEHIVKEINVRVRLANKMIDNSRNVALSVRGLLMLKFSNQSAESLQKMRDEYTDKWRIFNQEMAEVEKLKIQECPICYQLFLNIQSYNR